MAEGSNAIKHYTIMKRSALGLLCILIVSACAKMPVHQSAWYENGMNESSYQAASSDYQLSWNVYNDKEHLYIDIRTEHRASIMKMMRMGFQVFIDPTLKKNEQMGVTYPIKPKRPQGDGSGQRNESRQRPQGNRSGRQGRGGAPDFSKMLEHTPKAFIVNGLQGEKRTKVPELPEGYEVDLGIEEGVLQYTLKVPLKDFCDPSAVSELGIGFLSGAADINMMNRGGGAGRPGGGGPPGGGMGGGNMSAQMAEMADPIKIWFKAQMASSNE